MDKIARTDQQILDSVVGLASEPARLAWWHVLNGAHWRCGPQYGCRNRRFFAHQIMYVVQGQGEGEYRGERFHAGPGDAVLMDLADVHGYRSAPADPWEILWVRFDGPGVHPAVEALLSAHRSCVLPVSNRARMRRDFRTLFRLLASRPPAVDAQVAAQLLTLMVHLQASALQSGVGAPAAQPPAGIAAAAEYLRARHLETVALADAARAASMSPYHFLRRFKQVTGFTPMAYLENYRIGRAQELLLAQPDLRLKEIATRVGFSDPAYFSRVFRKRVGASPRAYRRSLVLRQA